MLATSDLRSAQVLHLKHVQKRSLLAFIQTSQQKSSQHPGLQLPAFPESVPEASQAHRSHFPLLPLPLILRGQSALVEQASPGYAQNLVQRIQMLKIFFFFFLAVVGQLPKGSPRQPDLALGLSDTSCATPRSSGSSCWIGEVPVPRGAQI